MIAAALLVTAMGALVKSLGQRLPAGEMAAVRSTFLMFLLLPMMMRQGRAVFRTARPGLMAMRALSLVIVNAGGFWTLTVLPLAYVTSISFTKPLFVTLLAVLLLGERLRRRRTLATAAGFFGVVVMVNPAAVPVADSQLAAAFVALCVALSMAVGVILVKRLAERDHPNTIIFYSNLSVTVLLAVPAAIWWVPPTAEEWLLLGLLGLIGLASQTCFIRAYRVAEASFVAPFEYVRLLSAAAAGYWLFSEVPGPWTAAGASLIVASTFYIARRDAALARAKSERIPAPAGG